MLVTFPPFSYVKIWTNLRDFIWPPSAASNYNVFFFTFLPFLGDGGNFSDIVFFLKKSAKKVTK